MNSSEKKIIIGDIIIIIILAISLFIMYNLAQTIKTEGGKCIKDPLAYYGNLGIDKCTVTCIGGLTNNPLKEPVASQINIFDWEKLLK